MLFPCTENLKEIFTQTNKGLGIFQQEKSTLPEIGFSQLVGSQIKPGVLCFFFLPLGTRLNGWKTYFKSFKAG